MRIEYGNAARLNRFDLMSDNIPYVAKHFRVFKQALKINTNQLTNVTIEFFIMFCRLIVGKDFGYLYLCLVQCFGNKINPSVPSLAERHN